MLAEHIDSPPFPPIIDAQVRRLMEGSRRPARIAPPTHLGAVVLKLNEWCQLDCDYCYVLNGSDQSWRSQPKVMDPEILRQTARRAGEYAAARGLSRFDFIFHGGEPLLAGAPYIDEAATAIRGIMGQCSPDTRVGLLVQTNTVLLNTKILEVMRKHTIYASVSLDGPKAVHDKHRYYKNRRGSYDDVRRGIDLLKADKYKNLLVSELAVVDPDSSPEAVYDELASDGPPMIDFLLPYGNWDKPPHRWLEGKGGTPYGDWLIRAYLRWKQHDPATRPDVRTFSSIMRLSQGGRSSTEALGRHTGAHITVRPNGECEGLDAFKATTSGATYTGMHVRENSFEEVAAFMRESHQLGEKPECAKCPFDLGDICGGGHMATRYSSREEQGVLLSSRNLVKGFSNPSVYCHDLERLIRYIQHDTQTSLRHAYLAASRQAKQRNEALEAELIPRICMECPLFKEGSCDGNDPGCSDLRAYATQRLQQGLVAPPGYLIRPARPGDGALIALTHGESILNSYPHPWEWHGATPAAVRRLVDDLRSRKDGNYWEAAIRAALDPSGSGGYAALLVAHPEGKESEVVAFSAIDDSLGSRVKLDALYIHPEHQGRRIGGAMMRGVRAYAEGRLAYLYAVPWTDAGKFYNRIGGRTTQGWMALGKEHPLSRAGMHAALAKTVFLPAADTNKRLQLRQLRIAEALPPLE